ncbi:MAG: shikimate dehydrogenase, partial [Myxococcales bacterium]|nr:shikimate dehydrogenase [Myxococcales bacterium]
RGHRVVDGRGMLAHQGARAFTLWLGRPAPVDVMLTAI